MSKNILFVVEGRRDESSFLIPVFKKALKLVDEDIKIFKYKANIYSLYNRMKKEGYDSFLSFLYSIDKSIFPASFITPEDSFSSVYLLFDLDPQSRSYSYDEMIELCGMFSDETRNGKLYLSVPMSQSVFDFCSYRQSDFNRRTYPINKLSECYKRDSRESSFLSIKYGTKSFRTIRIEDIYSISLLNMKKYYYLLEKPFDAKWATQFECQNLIKAEDSFIDKGIVSILCAGILLIPDYSPVLLEELKLRKK